MKSQVLKTDNAIMNEYFKLYDIYGETKECCNEIKKLIKSITSDRQDLWAAILNGVMCGFMCNKKYTKSYEELSNISIEDKESPLFIFVEREKMYAFAFIDEQNREKTLSAYTDLINHFDKSNDIAIQLQIAQTMLTQSYLLGVFGKLEEEVFVEDNLIKKFKNVNNTAIQIIIAKSINNQATTLEQISVKKETDTIDLRNRIVKSYIDTQDIRMQLQVSKSIFVNALALQQLYKIEEIKNTIGENKKEEYLIRSIAEYTKLINTFQNSDNLKIQQNVAYSIYFLGELSLENNDIENAINNFNILLTKFKYTKDKEIQVLYIQVLEKMFSILYDKKDFDNAFMISQEFSNFCESIKDEDNKRYATFVLGQMALIQKTILEQKRIAENQEKIKELFEFYSDNERSINDLIESISKGHTTPLIGAGLSKFAGYPLWNSFLNKVYNNTQNGIQEKILKDDFNKITSCIKKASEIHKILGQARFVREVKNYFSDAIMNKVDKEKLQEQPLYILPNLFKDQLILTTNFDNLIQKVYENNDTHIITTSAIDIDRLEQLANDKTVLYKIHGTIDIPNSIILTESDYEKHYHKDSDNYKILNSRMKGKDVLFLGCSLNEDDDILTFCTNGTNYAIHDCESKEKAQELALELGNKNIITILYPPKNEHAYLKIILEYIADCVSQKEHITNFNRTISQGGISMDTLMEQARSLQGKVADAQDELGKKILIGTSEDKCIIVKMTGKYDITDFSIDDSYIDYTKKDLEKSILSALQNAKKQTDETIDDIMGKATEGMPMPDDF